MSEIVTREVLTDAAGSYVRYVFADGHVETSPPGRPTSKEDLQRELRIAEALKNAKKTLKKTRTVEDSRLARQIARSEFDTTGAAAVIGAFTAALRRQSEFATTATAPAAAVDGLLSNASLGGDVKSPDKLPQREYRRAPTHQPGIVGAIVQPIELVREASDA